MTGVDDLGPVARGAARDPAVRTELRDRGSVTPLVIGMVACLLLLGAGVTAATSAFLARQSLQNACDGAAAAAADAARAGPYRDADAGSAALSAARDYLGGRHLDIGVAAQASTASVRLTCSAQSQITFGGLFGVATLAQTVQAVGHTVL